jgi:hypothetical protein
MGTYWDIVWELWEHVRDTVRTCWEQVGNKRIQKVLIQAPPGSLGVYAGSPHWLSRISMPTSVLYQFGRRLMAVGDIVSQFLDHPITLKTHVLPHGHNKTLDTPKPQNPKRESCKL